MIKYRLHCAHGHEFEAWFASSASFDAQAASGQIACPECHSVEVGKSIMAPNLAPRTRGDVAILDEEAPARYRNLVREVHRLGAWRGRPTAYRVPKASEDGLHSLLIVQGAAGGRILAAQQKP